MLIFLELAEPNVATQVSCYKINHFHQNWYEILKCVKIIGVKMRISSDFLTVCNAFLWFYMQIIKEPVIVFFLVSVIK